MSGAKRKVKDRTRGTAPNENDTLRRGRASPHIERQSRNARSNSLAAALLLRVYVSSAFCLARLGRLNERHRACCFEAVECVQSSKRKRGGRKDAEDAETPSV